MLFGWRAIELLLIWNFSKVQFVHFWLRQIISRNIFFSSKIWLIFLGHFAFHVISNLAHSGLAKICCKQSHKQLEFLTKHFHFKTHWIVQPHLYKPWFGGDQKFLEKAPALIGMRKLRVWSEFGSRLIICHLVPLRFLCFEFKALKEGPLNQESTRYRWEPVESIPNSQFYSLDK
jgi:hypothetical protein